MRGRAAAAVIVVAVLAGCGGGSSGTDTATSCAQMQTVMHDYSLHNDHPGSLRELLGAVWDDARDVQFRQTMKDLQAIAALAADRDFGEALHHYAERRVLDAENGITNIENDATLVQFEHEVALTCG